MLRWVAFALTTPTLKNLSHASLTTRHLLQFNISVLVTDELMKAVDNDSMFQLRFEGRVYKQVRARYLWDKDHAADLGLCRAGRFVH